jgi:hypothetical protein
VYHPVGGINATVRFFESNKVRLLFMYSWWKGVKEAMLTVG